MSPEAEIFLVGLALVATLAAIVQTRRHAGDVPGEFVQRLNVLQADVEAMRKEVLDNRKELAAIRKAYSDLFNENLRLQEIISWLRGQLRAHGVDIGRLPDDLRDPRTAALPVDDAAMLDRNTRQHRDQYDLLTEKIGRLEKQLILETGAAARFQIEEELKEARAALDTLKRGRREKPEGNP